MLNILAGIFTDFLANIAMKHVTKGDGIVFQHEFLGGLMKKNVILIFIHA